MSAVERSAVEETGHRSWCARPLHDRELRQDGEGARGCYSDAVSVTGRVGAWLIEGPERVEAALDGPEMCLFLPTADVQALCRWLLELDPLEVQPALVRLSELVGLDQAAGGLASPQPAVTS